jgi:mono/diheme cytochrome c family protein
MNMKRFFPLVIAATAAFSTVPSFLHTTFLQSARAAENTVSDQLSGEQLYKRNCEVCHSMRPPAKAAPPIVRLASRYRMLYGNKEDAVNAMVSFMKTPDASKSVLMPHVIERFGLMPAMSLPDEELENVAGWLWDQYDPIYEKQRGYYR